MSAESTPTVLITGAAGFIGGRLCEVLHLTGAAHVRAGIHRWSGAGLARLARLPLPMVMCDVLDRAQVAQAVDGADLVIHAAMSSREVNVEGTRAVLEAARQHGARVVFISSAEVYGSACGEVDETVPVVSGGWDYAASKAEAERLCLEAAQRGLAVSVVRPSIVYGPFSQIWIVRFAERLESGRWHVLRGYGDGCCNLIYVDDLVRGIWLAAWNDRAVGQIFNLNGPEVITWNDYFRRFNAALGRPPLAEWGPRRALAQTAILSSARTALVYAKNRLGEPARKKLLGGTRKTRAGLLANQARSSVRSVPSVDELRRLYRRQAIYTDRKARSLLGYVPRVDVETGLARSVQWLVHNGWGADGRG